MEENNRSYRIRTKVDGSTQSWVTIDVNLLQDYDNFEILSLKIDTENFYKYHTANYGCVVGRVLANGGVGVPNAKVSIFISASSNDLTDPVLSALYPYTNTRTKNSDEIRYNLLTDKKIDECHQNIGTFPNKRLVLDDDNIIEVYDNYYKFTTSSNGAGDYMIFGIPVGNYVLHTDIDLSDIGILSQKPRDFYYKGYTKTQFENSSQFKKDSNLDNLAQVFSQDNNVYVYPFWGDEENNDGLIKIVRRDIDINYKFEPTCVFIGSIVSDDKSNGISKNCLPTDRMGKMDRLITGQGTIEMIRKTIDGDVESVTIQGNELIDGNGTWCYQIPMNLDYMTTDEYGNLVPSNDTKNGIPTRARVRFRVSLSDYESDYEQAHLVKVLVPNNPKVGKDDNYRSIKYDYGFGTQTTDDSFRDLLMNNVYSVKQYIPRFQRGTRTKNKKFSGFKAVNVNGANNQIPYNNIRINLTFLFVFQCLLFKCIIRIVTFINKMVAAFSFFNADCTSKSVGAKLAYVTIDAGMCPTLDGNFIAPGAKREKKYSKRRELTQTTYTTLYENNNSDFGIYDDDNEDKGVYQGSTFLASAGTIAGYSQIEDDYSNENRNTIGSSEKSGIYNLRYNENQETEETEIAKIIIDLDYYEKCVELQFAMEYEVIQFDFYNDWINGMLYIPRWFASIRKNKSNMYYCGEGVYSGKRKFVQQCAVQYTIKDDNLEIYSRQPFGCHDTKQRCHKKSGISAYNIFGKTNGGIVHVAETMKGQKVYYLRPSEMYKATKINLFATDIILLGSMNKYNEQGIPLAKGYPSTTFKTPPPTAMIVSDSDEMNIELWPIDSTQSNTCLISGDFNKEYKAALDEAWVDYKKDNNKTKYLETRAKILSKYHPFFYFWETRRKPLSKNKSSDDPYEGNIELSGIDWGYNPFTEHSGKTDTIDKQIGGHFLEISCTNASTNIKSCVNLSRICELGSEISQSQVSNGISYDPTGIISKNEISGKEIKTMFATLNYNNLNTIDDDYGNKKYSFSGLTTYNFAGGLKNFDALLGNLEKNLDETPSYDYAEFRFGNPFKEAKLRGWMYQFAEGNNNYGRVPIFENSFYFYFGLVNGNTAIDRLYNEYFSDCKNEGEELKSGVSGETKATNVDFSGSIGVK